MIYAVAGTYTKNIPSGLNIVCAIRKISAVSEDEAIGKFIKMMAENLPEHGLHVHPVHVLFEDIDLLEDHTEGSLYG